MKTTKQKKKKLPYANWEQLLEKINRVWLYC